MSHLQPPWLHSCLQDSHLAFAVRTLDSREAQRESARIARITSPTNSRARLPRLHISRPPVTSQLEDHFSSSVGQHPAHKRANRYLALEPYNRTRVLVPDPDQKGHVKGDTSRTTANASDTRYLNASWVRETAGGKWWIAGQAPLPNTMHAFLTLGMCPTSPPSLSSPPLKPRRVRTVIQLTQLVEVGRRRAHPYFSGALQQDMIINPEPGCNAPPIYVHVANEENIESAQCVKTELRLRWGSVESDDVEGGLPTEECVVTHLLYNGWPDFGVPKDNHSILNFARLAERVNNHTLSHHSDDSSASPPILVHCSAGVGRTGSFITLCSLLRAHSLLLSPAGSSTSNLKPSLAPPLPVSPLGPLPEALRDDLVAQEIDGLREQRTSMVQKDEQAIWVYKTLRDAFDGM